MLTGREQNSGLGRKNQKCTAPALGRVVWTELLANDPRAAAKFYASVIGYDPRIVTRRGGEYIWLTHDGAERAGVFKNPSANADPTWLTIAVVIDPTGAILVLQKLMA